MHHIHNLDFAHCEINVENVPSGNKNFNIDQHRREQRNGKE